ncbi:MAG TPA: LacI family DNA-binding transcriptional regulator [Chthonomonadaceae bacterium]|nr:LacI family DNA-binding transcriptional regulator [Chthonomonadaceae bacterium]
MHLKRVRMVDVAQAAGVSRTTASLVLNGRAKTIAAATRQRVLQAAQQMGYSRHATALALRTGRTRRIGIVLNEPEDFDEHDVYFSTVLAGITKGALSQDYNLVLHSCHYMDWHELYSDILSPTADGVLLVGRFIQDPLTPALLDAGFPCVCISYQVSHPDCYSVDCDNIQGGYLAAQHLFQLGHRQIAFLYPGETVRWGRDRLAGAQQAAVEAGLSPPSFHLYQWPDDGNMPSEASIHAAVRFLQTCRPRPTAMICCDELRAQSITECLPSAGIRVPEDLAVVSFNSTEQSARTRPPMTSVAQPLREIGFAAVEMLVDLIEGREVAKRCLRFPMSLDVRESCGARTIPAHSVR